MPFIQNNIGFPGIINQGSIEPTAFKAPYLYWDMKVNYIWHSGKLMLPVAQDVQPGDPRPQASVVQAHAPYGYKVVTFVGVRAVIPPDVPDPAPTTDNDVLLYSNSETSAPALDQDNKTHIYAVRGVYVYGLKGPVYPTDGLPMGKRPDDTTQAVLNTLPATSYRQDLLTDPPIGNGP